MYPMRMDALRSEDTGEQSDALALGQAYLYGAGAALAVLVLLLPHGRGVDELAMALMASLAAVWAALLVTVGRHLPPLVYGCGVVVGTIIVALCVWFGGRPFGAFYVWISLYAFYFFPVRHALAMVGFALVTHVVLLATGDVSPVPWSDATMIWGTSLVAGTLIAWLVRQLRAHAADLDAAAALANDMSARPDVSWARQAICEAACAATGADAAVMVEGSVVVARSGDARVADSLAARPEVTTAASEGRRHVLGERRARAVEPHVSGLVQPVLRDGRPVAALALAWGRPLRRLPERAANATALFAAEAAVVIEREERLSGERERRALEINDNIVQGLVVAKYALDIGREHDGVAAVERTLGRARDLMDRQLDLGTPSGPEPGDLRRRAPGLAPEP
jgi:hypothetical protein